ncbi:MAG: serine hydrolase [Bacteroidia bacterium]
MKGFYLIGIFVLSLMACRSPQETSQNLLYQLLEKQSGPIGEVLQNSAKYRLQILYTQIDRDADQNPHFSSFSYRLNEDDYFYPASSVKFPAALLALEKLKQLEIDPYTPMLTDSGAIGQSAVLTDSSSASLLPSVAHYARKLFLLSDNDAFNRLYEFLGQGPLNDSLHNKGYAKTRIVHRLSIALSEEQNATTNPLRFVQNDSLLYQQALAKNVKLYWDDNSILLGLGEMQSQQLLEAPKDFAHKNYFPLDEQQQMLKAIFFPEQAGQSAFDLGSEDYSFLYRAMGERPRESDYPHYPDSIFYDGYVKFFMYGDTHDTIPDHIRIFNKVGVAYGFLTDNAYIIDLENGVEFMLSATLWTNENQIFNDDQYEYEELGFPFLAELGRIIYAHELKRERTVMPDLSRYWHFDRLNVR